MSRQPCSAKANPDPRSTAPSRSRRPHHATQGPCGDRPEVTFLTHFFAELSGRTTTLPGDGTGLPEETA